MSNYMYQMVSGRQISLFDADSSEEAEMIARESGGTDLQRVHYRRGWFNQEFYALHLRFPTEEEFDRFGPLIHE